MVKDQTFALLSHAHAALVTSGTATLETALFGVPQVVCYHTVLPHFIGFMRKIVLSVRYVSLVNLIADREIVKELVADLFTDANIRHELSVLLEGEARQRMLDGYKEVSQALGTQKAPDQAARLMVSLLARN
jgi:lipid-A-disaccharide synthase